MKRKQSTTTKRPSRTAAVGRKTAHRRRPLHKRVLLHPFSVMVLLCTGVLIAGSTFHGSAESYDVTASVSASLPGSPALITRPVDQEHFSTRPITVEGTCPPQSYVKIFRNNAFSGAGLCSGNTFQIQTDLATGANQLAAHVYNLTDNEGPASIPLTVYYEETVIPPAPPPAPPTQLQIGNVGNGQFQQGQIKKTSMNPTITGTAPPYAEIVITFHSDVTTCITRADGAGWWSCTLEKELPVGIHRVDVLATTIEGKQLAFPSFQINVQSSLPDLVKKSVDPFLIQSEYLYQAHKPGQNFSFSLNFGGGQAPFDVTVDWGDSQQTKTVRNDQSEFVVSHIYEKAGDYVVVIKVTDANGTTASMQLLAVVKKNLLPVAAIARDDGLTSLLAAVQRYLWIVWPVYIFVVLMVLSYWIGEQEAYRRLVNRRLAYNGSKRRR